MSIPMTLVSNTQKALVASGITAGLSYFLNGSQNVDVFGTSVPLFLIQGLTVGGSVFIAENTKNTILPLLGVKDLNTAIYIVEPAITGLSSAGITAILTGFTMETFIKDTLIGFGATTSSVYLSNAFSPTGNFFRR